MTNISAKTTLPRIAFPGGEGTRTLPEEVAVAISYNGSTHAVMMASPADLEDFGYGFSLTEDVAHPDQIESVTAVTTPRGIDLQIWLGAEAADRQTTRRRTMMGPVGCGLCGIDSLDEALRDAPRVESDVRLSPDQVLQAMADLPRHQPLHDATRAVHAAALWTPETVTVREDVGRHNALDKLAGALRGRPAAGALILTSRVSIDMVQKAARIAAPIIIAVSSPTAHAVRLADAAGITLIGLARPDRFEVFTRPDRIG